MSKKRTISILSALALILSNFLGFVPNTYATEYGEGDYFLTLSVDSNSAWLAGLTVDGHDWTTSTDVFRSNSGNYFLTAELHIPNDNVKANTSIRTGGGIQGNFEIQQAGATEDLVGSKKFTFTMNYNVPEAGNYHISLNPYSENNPAPGPDGPDGPDEPIIEGNTEATVRLRGGEGSYTENIRNENGEIIDTRTVYYSESYTEANFAINDTDFFHQMRLEDAVEGENYSQTSIHYDSNEEAETVDISLSTLWHLKFVDKIVINGIDYSVADYIDYDDQASYLDHYSGQMVAIVIRDVAKSDIYDITVKVGRSEHSWIGNFLWTSDPAQKYEIRRDENGDPVIDEDGNIVYETDADGNLIPGRDYIGNSSLALVAFSFTVGASTYECNADEGACIWWTEGDLDEDGEQIIHSCNVESEDACSIPYVEFDNGNTAGYDDGSLVIPSGARITMRVIPDYGYQVLNVNMAELETNADGIGEFTFTVPEGAAYFVADVVEMSDTVKSNTDKVSGGSIDLGEDQTTLTHGTARLEVSNVELTDENKAAFENAAGDYEIKNYLDISLYNITCKGAAVCTGSDEDSWNERISDLNEPATITLQLEEGFDGSEIVIVHEKHDGTYEIIPSTYDPETNTITFTTTSFSNYAIASKTALAPNSGIITNAEQGGPLSMLYALVIALGLAIVVKRTTKR